MSNKTKCDKNAFQKSRRKVLKGLTAGIGALALPAANVWQSMYCLPMLHPSHVGPALKWINRRC